MTGNEVRDKYINFFAARGHYVVPSSSLVPENDPTTLFTGSGMQPMLPYLLGEVHPQGTRIVDSQRCFRVQDIEEVGDNRHTTSFEMLGNWSLGDYFKTEQLHWLWEFVTQELQIDPTRLYVSVYEGGDGVSQDDQAIAIWQEIFDSAGIKAKVVQNAAAMGMQNGRIFTYLGKNWWSRAGAPGSMPAGEPGGPDSELFYEFLDVEHDPAFGEHCHVNCDCGRFLEIGNSVFMQYQKQLDGSFKELPQRNIDFGGGLERMLAAANDASDIFTCDLHWPVIEYVSQLSNKRYDTDHRYSFQVIADHLKAAVMLLGDGVVPSNKAQGYVLRRVLRRAIRHGQLLGINGAFLANVGTVVQSMYDAVFPHLLDPHILELLSQEEAKFGLTLERGLREVHKLIRQEHWQESVPLPTVIAEYAFNVYQTYGLPSDIFLDELLSQFPRMYNLDERQEVEQQVRVKFLEHQALSRQGAIGMFKGGLGGQSRQEIEYHTTTHLLQQALRDVLGEAVVQRGSNITPDRLRFDFTAEHRLTAEQKVEVETIVNAQLKADLPVSFTVMPLVDAEKTGAIHAFGEKYGEAVKVYSIGELSPDVVVNGCDTASYSTAKQLAHDTDELRLACEVSELVPRSAVYSREFCGGPHVQRTGFIHGRFVIDKDEKISRDVVRIKARLLGQ